MSCSGSKLFLIGGEGEVYSPRKVTKNNVVYTIDIGELYMDYIGFVVDLPSTSCRTSPIRRRRG